jgi:hypothetical protein
MFIEITEKLEERYDYLYLSEHPPSVTLRDISGRPGQDAPGNKYVGEGEPGDQFFENATGQRDDRVDAAHHAGAVAVRVRPYKHGGRNNDRMPNNIARANDLSWLHPAALTATLSHARLAYRNGYRYYAATAIEPYYQLMREAPQVAAATTGTAAASPLDPDIRLALTAVLSMKNSLEQNLDYYGNPPGWVPHLDALTNLKLLKDTREAAYETFYFAEKMLSDYEALEDKNALSKLMSEALTKDINGARGVLGSAYENMPRVLIQTRPDTAGFWSNRDCHRRASKEGARGGQGLGHSAALRQRRAKACRRGSEGPAGRSAVPGRGRRRDRVDRRV